MLLLFTECAPFAVKLVRWSGPYVRPCVGNERMHFGLGEHSLHGLWCCVCATSRLQEFLEVVKFWKQHEKKSIFLSFSRFWLTGVPQFNVKWIVSDGSIRQCNDELNIPSPRANEKIHPFGRQADTEVDAIKIIGFIFILANDKLNASHDCAPHSRRKKNTHKQTNRATNIR